jgi:hypothetical protein
MKSEKKQSRLMLVVAVLLLGGGAALALLLPPRLTVAFCDMDPALAASMEKTIDLWAKDSRVSVKYRRAPIAALDAKSLRGVDVFFFYPSISNRRFSGSFATIKPELAEPLSLTLRRSVEADGRAWALPLAADTMELAWRRDLFGQGSKPGAARLSELGPLALAIREKTSTPLVISGGEDGSLLDLAGLLVLEDGGLASYRKLASLAEQENSSFAALLGQDLGSGRSLRSELECLKAYKEAGYIHNNWLDFKAEDLVSFIDGGVSGLAVESLSQHRLAAYEAISAWESAVIAATPNEGLPVVTASLVSIARPKAGGNEKAFSDLAAFLLSADGQRALEAGSGLAPTSSGVSAADAQASTARSAVNGAIVVQGFARDGFSSVASRSEFAEDLRLYLMSPQNKK